MMADPPLIAYPPIKRIIKQEIPDEQQEVNSVEEGKLDASGTVLLQFIL